MINKDVLTSIPNYRCPHNLKTVAHEYAKELLEANVIQASTSPFNSPILFVKKPPKFDKDGNRKLPKSETEAWRLTIDYRHLNSNLQGFSYPLNHVTDLVDQVASNKIHSIIDLKNGFWCQRLTPESRKYTAFSIPAADGW